MTDMLTIAKRAIEEGETTFKKVDFTAAIERRAAAIKKAGESDAKAFTRAITEDEAGRTLFRASKVADGPDHVLGSTARKADAPHDPPPPEFYGPANVKLHEKAVAHLASHPELSKHPTTGKPMRQKEAYARAHAAVSAAEPDLRDEAKMEHLAAAYRVTHGKAPWDDTRAGRENDGAPGNRLEDVAGKSADPYKPRFQTALAAQTGLSYAERLAGLTAAIAARLAV